LGCAGSERRPRGGQKKDFGKNLQRRPNYLKKKRLDGGPIIIARGGWGTSTSRFERGEKALQRIWRGGRGGGLEGLSEKVGIYSNYMKNPGTR